MIRILAVVLLTLLAAGCKSGFWAEDPPFDQEPVNAYWQVSGGGVSPSWVALDPPMSNAPGSLGE